VSHVAILEQWEKQCEHPFQTLNVSCNGTGHCYNQQQSFLSNILFTRF